MREVPDGFTAKGSGSPSRASGPGWARRGLAVLTAIAVFSALLTALGGEAEVRLAGARLRIGGFERPFLLSLLLLVIVGLAPDGWLSSLRGGRAPAEVLRSPPGRVRWFPTAACVLGVLLLLSPLVMPAKERWPDAISTRIGFVLIAFVGALYAALARWGLFPRRLSVAEVFLLIGLPLYVLLVGNGVLITSGDNHVTRVLAARLLSRGSLDLSHLPVYPHFDGESVHYSGIVVRGRVLPSFPLGTGLLSLPYSAAALAGSGGTITEDLVNRWEKHFSALVLMLAAMTLFLGARRRFGQMPALGVTVVFALGTNAFTCVGQALWTTTGEVLFLCTALALLLQEAPGNGRLFLAGLSMAGAFLCRPTAVVPLGILAVVVGLRRRRDAIPFLASAAVAIGVTCFVLYRIYGHPLGGYGLMNARPGKWGGTVLVGLAGNLLSPSRGLFPHFPYLLLVPLAVRRCVGDRNLMAWWFGSFLAASSTVVLASAYSMWWGGYSLGPRLLTEATPFFALLTLPVWRSWHEIGRLRGPFLVALGFAVATQLLGAYNPRASAWNAVLTEQSEPGILWSVRDSQLAATWVPGWTRSTRPPKEETTGDVSRWHRLDLSAAANARYDLDPFRPGAPADAPPHYSRIDPDAFNRPRSLFHFGKPGRNNAITTCQGAQPGDIRVPEVPISVIHAILAAGVTNGRTGTPVVANLVLALADGSEESLPIHLNRDVFEYQPALRGSPIPASRLYWGLPQDRDALVRARFRPGRLDCQVRAIRVVNADAESSMGVTVLAMTLVEPQGEPAGWEDFDLLGAVDAPSNGSVVRGPVEVRGWARVPGEDLDVSIRIDDEIRVVRNWRRVPRPDVCAVVAGLGECSTAGFEGIIDMNPADEEGTHYFDGVFRSRAGAVRHYPPARFEWKR